VPESAGRDSRDRCRTADQPPCCSTVSEVDVAAMGEEIQQLRADLATAQTRADNLEIALHTNRRIGTAVGITMSEYGLTTEAALGLLQTASQHSNRKLREMAEDVIYTGTLDLRPAAWSPGRVKHHQRVGAA
jgi:ANTAR domain